MKKITLSFLFVLVTLVSGGWVANAGTPVLQVHPERLIFECEAGRSYTRTFTVSGMNLTENLTLTMFGDDTVFTMNKTVISVHEADDGAEVTVRFSPKEVGEFGANIWIKSNEVSAIVQLFGTGLEGPSVTTSTTSLNFNCMVDGMATATFTVTGRNLEDDIWLDLVGSPDHQAFSIDKINIPCNEANVTSIVTVNYQPRQLGNDTATVYVSSRYSNEIAINLYGKAMMRPYEVRNLILMGDVYDIDEGGGEMVPAEPSGCGLFTQCVTGDNNMNLNLYENLLNIDLDFNNMTASLPENVTQVSETSDALFFKATRTETNYYLRCDETLASNDAQQGIINGRINEDGSISFDGFIIETEKIVSIINTRTNQVISIESISHDYNVYRNVLLAESNGTHKYSIPSWLDPGTVQPMHNVQFGLSAQVYIQQIGDTVTVYNLYGMGGRNTMVLDNGFFDWPWQPCGYNDEGGYWYNYTYYRSYQPSGDVMLNVVTYPHRIPGIKGRVTADEMTWGQINFGDGHGVWSSDVYCDNRLFYKGSTQFVCEETVWSIGDVTRLIDGLITEDPVILTHPASDVNCDGTVTISDVSFLIDVLLNSNH